MNVKDLSSLLITHRSYLPVPSISVFRSPLSALSFQLPASPLVPCSSLLPLPSIPEFQHFRIRFHFELSALSCQLPACPSALAPHPSLLPAFRFPFHLLLYHCKPMEPRTRTPRTRPKSPHRCWDAAPPRTTTGRASRPCTAQARPM